jgi:hypothetical protein
MTSTDVPPRIDRGEELLWNKRAIAAFVGQSVLLLVGWLGLFVGAFWVSPLVQLMAIPFLFVVILLLNRTVLSVVVCGWNRSRLSNHVRVEVPPAFHHWREAYSFARIGWMNVSWPLARWRCGPQGLALSIFLLGEFYLPMECIVRIQKTSLWRCRIEHTSPDLKSPIITGSGVQRLIVSCLPECLPAEP